MHSLTTNELAILGLLAEQPRYGYDLEQTIRDRGMREWTPIGFSSLYYLLERLESKGLIRYTADSGKAVRKVFAITDKGLKICRQSIKDALVNMEPYNPTFSIALANSSLLSEAEFIRLLSARERLVNERLASVVATQTQQQPLPDFVNALFDHNKSLLEAESMWLQKTVATMNTMDKIDLKKELKEFYNPSSKEFSVVNVPRMNFLMVDGQGNPNTAQVYKDAVEVLYTLSYTIKFASKKQLGKDYAVMPLEGLWTADDMNAFTTRAKDTWKWTMMIMQPDWITKEMVAEAIEVARIKKNPAALDQVRFEAYDEGRSVQIMHIGSYDEEAPTLYRLHHEFMPQQHLSFNGLHHEIYIGDPRKADPSKLKTVLRQPVK